MALESVKALLFDVFGTVVDWRGSIIREGEALSRVHGWHVDWGAFADEWRQEGYIQAIARINRGEAPWSRVDQLHRQKLLDLLQRHRLVGLSEREIDWLNRVWHRLQPWSDAVPGLVRLKRRFTIAPLSNGDFALLADMAKHAGLPWDCIIAAELFGKYKPEPDVYRGGAMLLGFEPTEVMMVAAHQGDLRAAAGIGLRTAYVPRPLEYGPAGPHEEAPDAAIDVVAGDFIDLAARLDALMPA